MPTSRFRVKALVTGLLVVAASLGVSTLAGAHGQTAGQTAARAATSSEQTWSLFEFNRSYCKVNNASAGTVDVEVSPSGTWTSPLSLEVRVLDLPVVTPVTRVLPPATAVEQLSLRLTFTLQLPGSIGNPDDNSRDGYTIWTTATDGGSNIQVVADHLRLPMNSCDPNSGA